MRKNSSEHLIGSLGHVAKPADVCCVCTRTGIISLAFPKTIVPDSPSYLYFTGNKFSVKIYLHFVLFHLSTDQRHKTMINLFGLTILLFPFNTLKWIKLIIASETMQNVLK